MGYTYRNHGLIKDFTPDDTETEFYMNTSYGSYSIQEILDKIKEKFGDGVDLDQVEIKSEYIHTECLGYDKYDPGDYSNYLVISRVW